MKTERFDCESEVAQALPHLRAILTIMSGSRERADILIEHALSRCAGQPLEHRKTKRLFSELIGLARMHEATVREAFNATEEHYVSFLQSLPFSDRLAYVLVEIAGLSPIVASRLCGDLPDDLQRCACDAGDFLSRYHDDHVPLVANSGTPEYEFPS